MPTTTDDIITADGRSTGLAPAVATRLGAVLVLARAGKESDVVAQPLLSVVVLPSPVVAAAAVAPVAFEDSAPQEVPHDEETEVFEEPTETWKKRALSPGEDAATHGIMTQSSSPVLVASCCVGARTFGAAIQRYALGKS